jgi:hypothetical protein
MKRSWRRDSVGLVRRLNGDPRVEFRRVRGTDRIVRGVERIDGRNLVVRPVDDVDQCGYLGLRFVVGGEPMLEMQSCISMNVSFGSRISA